MQSHMNLDDAIRFCCHFHDAYTGDAEAGSGTVLRLPIEEIYFGEQYKYLKDGVSCGVLELTLREKADTSILKWLSLNKLIDVSYQDGVLEVSNGERLVKLRVDGAKSRFIPG